MTIEWTPEMVATLAEMRAKRIGTRPIAKRLRISETSARRYIHSAGLTVYRQGRPTKVELKEIANA